MYCSLFKNHELVFTLTVASVLLWLDGESTAYVLAWSCILFALVYMCDKVLKAIYLHARLMSRLLK
jgi:hypothetical protein